VQLVPKVKLELQEVMVRRAQPVQLALKAIPVRLVHQMFTAGLLIFLT